MSANSIAGICLCLTAALGLPGIVGGHSNFDYGLFENMEVTEAVFGEELILKDRLLAVREDLATQQLLLKASASALLTGGGGGGGGDLAQVARRLSSLANVTEAARIRLGPASLPFEGTASFRGALRGILMLKETYRIGARELASGRMELFSPASFGRERFSSDFRLDAHDLVDLAGTAVMDGWIDDAVELVRIGMEALEESGELRDESLPTHLRDHLEQLPAMRGFLPRVQNELLEKRRALVGKDFKILPYAIDENLERKEEQPEYLADVLNRRATLEEIVRDADKKEYRFRSICRRELIGEEVLRQSRTQRCSFLHHHDPYLKLGPFKMEVLLEEPFRMVFHDFLSEEEMLWMVEHSRPKLSTKRGRSANNERARRNTPDPDVRRIVHKTVQVWLRDKEYAEEARYEELPGREGGYAQLDFEGDPDAGRVTMPVMRGVARKMELATGMRVLSRFASTDFQVTNYGLGGLCETHIDPHGMLEGAYVDWEQRALVSSGDMMATFMAWLEDVRAGGETGFDHVGYSQTVTPTRGSAAFWIDLDRAGMREARSSHGGCPVAIGSKWILNKWIYYFDQFANFPCGLDSLDQFKPFTAAYA